MMDWRYTNFIIFIKKRRNFVPIAKNLQITKFIGLKNIIPICIIVHYNMLAFFVCLFAILMYLLPLFSKVIVLVKLSDELNMSKY